MLMRYFLLCLTCTVVKAPKGLSAWELLRGRNNPPLPPGSRGGLPAPAVAAVVLTGACGCAMNAPGGKSRSVLRCAAEPGPRPGGRVAKGGRAPASEPASTGGGDAGSSGREVAAGKRAQQSEDAEEKSHDTESDPDSVDEADGEDGWKSMDCDEEPRVPATGATGNSSGKLWSKAEFPEGCVPIQACWDMENLRAAQAWTCPCADRDSCISEDRLKLLELYEYRKHFQTTCANGGGKRDATRKELQQHADAAGNTTRSFVVGPLNDCCAASAGLAKGISFGTYATARADMRKQRPMRQGRKRRRTEREHVSRRTIEAYIRMLRGGMEGAKGRDAPDNWSTGKRTVPKRWEDYRKFRIRKKLPVVGSYGLFKKLWVAHTEIHEYGAKGHPKCDDCGRIEAEKDALEERRDDQAVSKKKELDLEQAEHDLDHRGEREYASDIWNKAECNPDLVTAVNFDAPTEDEFDVPVQRRMARDVVKSLEGQKKWSSKIMGVMCSGWGMIAYVSRAGLGSGPNLTCTCIYKTLMMLEENGRELGRRLNALMDNTSGDNKNNEFVQFLAWLVDEDYFSDDSFFCQLKGHTFTIIDQSFNTMISQMKGENIYSVETLLSFILKFLRPYGCREVVELNQLWDWKAKFEPHVCSRFKGFCTGQFGSGMHDVYIRKVDGITRIWFRKSSKASSWFPEGPGYQVFKTHPGPGAPPPAKAKEDTVWQRETVEATVRSWYRFMACGEAESVRVREEWEARFSCLPPMGDTTKLPAAMQLTWKVLCKRTPEERREKDIVRQLRRAVSGALENPPVNPIAGNGRTEADVRRDLLQYQDHLRTEPLRLHEALFQADYIFVRLPGKPLCLQRVCSGLFIEDAIDAEITFQTLQYALVPNADASLGLWGCFEPEDNTAYDPNDKRKGTMLVRFDEVDRSHVTVYNVAVVLEKVKRPTPVPGERVPKPKPKLRVLFESLLRLSMKCPEVVVPDKLPSSHAHDPGAREHARKIAAAKRAGRGKGGGARGGGGGRGGARGGARGGGRSAGGRGSGGEASGGSENEVSESEEGESDAGESEPGESNASGSEAAASQAGEGEESEGEEESEESDPEPPMVLGFQHAEWEGPAQAIVHFLIWTRVDRGPAEWHQGRVTRKLTSRRGGFTHDAVLDGGPLNQARGVILSEEVYDSGCWVLLEADADSSENEEGPAGSAPAESDNTHNNNNNNDNSSSDASSDASGRSDTPPHGLAARAPAPATAPLGTSRCDRSSRSKHARI